MLNDTVMFYHANCPDGFGAAWAAWKKFGDKAEYIPLTHRTSLPEGLRDMTIFFLDIVPSYEDTEGLLKKNKRVTAIDHHITGEDAVRLTDDYSYASDHSGSVLAWKYFHPKKDIPQLLLHIEDFDLWKFTLPETEKVDVLLDSIEFDFETWNKLADDFENPEMKAQYIEHGGMLLRYRERLVGEAAQDAQLVRFEGHDVLASNSPFFHSQIAHVLYEERPPLSIVWRAKKDGSVKVSLRSDGTVDVAKIAEKYGGGGHKAAAGFSLGPEEKVPWKAVE